MVTTANTISRNGVEPPKIKVVNSLPTLGDAEMGEMFFLIDDSSADTLKIHIRAATGFIKSATMS